MGSRLPVMPAPTIHPTATNKVNVANGVFSPNNSMHADVKMTMTSAHSMKGTIVCRTKPVAKSRQAF